MSVIKKTFLDLQITCKLEYDLLPVEEHVEHFDLHRFLDDLKDNPDIIGYLFDGESVSTGLHEFDPWENDSVQIVRLGDPDLATPFYIPLNHLKTISDTLELYDHSKRRLEIEIEFSLPANSSGRAIINYSALTPDKSESFSGHSYQIVESCEDDIHPLEVPSTLDAAFTSLDAFNHYHFNKLQDRQKLFNEMPVVSLPESNSNVSPGPGSPDRQIQSSVSTSLTELTSNVKGVEPEECLAISTTEKEIVVKEFSPSGQEYLLPQSKNLHKSDRTPEQTDQINSMPTDYNEGHASKLNNISGIFQEPPIFQSSEIQLSDTAELPNQMETVSNKVTVSDVQSKSQPEEGHRFIRELPPPEFDPISQLLIHLRKDVGEAAYASVKYNPSRQIVDMRPVFSNGLSFMVNGRTHNFENTSDCQFFNKKDAKKNVAYQACIELGLCKAPEQKLPTVTKEDLSPLISPNSDQNMTAPPEGFNFVGKLNEYLQRKGDACSLLWHEDGSFPSFYCTATFLIDDMPYKFISLRCKTKKEAKRSAAFNACKGLGLV